MENKELLNKISNELGIKIEQVEATLSLLAEGATVPFIARYRKEQTGALTEDKIREIEEQYNYQLNLEKRKEDVIRLIEEKGLMTEELKLEINAATKLVEVEDLYRPYKEKKKTKATEAIMLGLEPLADKMLKYYTGNKEEIVSKYLNDKVKSYDEAITGAKYIIAERISDEARYRKHIREKALIFGTISSKLKKNAEDLEQKFKLYYDNNEMIGRVKPHRVLAMNRGEDLGILNVSINLQPERDIEYITRGLIGNKTLIFKDEIIDSINDAYKRLIAPSIEREIKTLLVDEALKKATELFSLNVKNLLLQAPLKGNVILGVDPAFRTGCKLACIDQNGKLLEVGVIYPNERSVGATVNEASIIKSRNVIAKFVKKYNVNIIAIGNGTASRETEAFIAETIKECNLDVKYVIVSEAGASVYSASPLAKEEFPDLEVQERSAISIARRILDPLSELVKIDPKSIGVGQYQHDINAKDLSESLDNVVSDAVNKVGVNLNTASVSLLTYVSGLNKSSATEIVNYRESVGGFKNRNELLKVKKIGPKSFTQAIGFLRILDSNNLLDMTPIHPESYPKAEQILKILGLTVNDLGTTKMKEAVKTINKEEIIKKVDIDSYTLDDILEAFVSPLRDIRDDYETPKLRTDILHFEDLKLDDVLEGTIRNITDFGCFIDCGVKYSGLLHRSHMHINKDSHPSDLFSVGDFVTVKVINIDYDLHKLGLELINS